MEILTYIGLVIFGFMLGVLSVQIRELDRQMREKGIPYPD